MKRSYYTYIMSNYTRTVLYIGITNTLERRYMEHQMKLNPNSFTARYNVKYLIYFEEYNNPIDAIRREKELKGWTRKKKEELIRTNNLEMKSLFNDR